MLYLDKVKNMEQYHGHIMVLCYANLYIIMHLSLKILTINNKRKIIKVY